MTDRRAFWRCRECGTPNPSRPYLTRCVGCGEARPIEPAPEAAAPARVRVPVAPSPSPARVRVRRWCLWSTYGAAALVLLALALIRWVGDAWWGVMVLLFLPRWLFLVPMAALMVASGWVRKPSHWPFQVAIALVIAGPLMHFTVPTERLRAEPVAGARFRLMTLNRGQDELATDRLIDLLEREHIDLICFQEGNTAQPSLHAYFAEHGWRVDPSGFLASRHPIVADLPPLVEENAPEECYGARLHRVRVRTASGTEFILASVHMPTIRPGFYRFMAGDVAGLTTHITWWRHQLDRVVVRTKETADTPLVLAGDFNMPADDSTMAALSGPFRLGFEEAGWGYGYTRPTKSPWVRIDHILTSPEWQVTRCWVGPDFGSDHLPLVAELVLPPTVRVEKHGAP